MRELLQKLRDALYREVSGGDAILDHEDLLAAADAELAKPAPEHHLTDEELREIHHIEEFGLFCDVDEFIDIARHIERVVLNRVLYTAPPYLQARVEGLRTLLRRANHQLSAWHATYGQNNPDWLPPGGDVRLQEDIDAALAAQESGK